MTHRIAILLILVSSILSAAAGYWLRDLSADRDLSECTEQQALAVASALRAVQKAEADFRAREAKLNEDHKEVVRVANNSAAAARADADRVRALLERLRRTPAPAPGGGHPTQDSGPAAGGDPAGAAPDLQADMLGRIGQAAGELAAYADQARVAGRACQAAYAAARAATKFRLGQTPSDPWKTALWPDFTVGGNVGNGDAPDATPASHAPMTPP